MKFIYFRFFNMVSSYLINMVDKVEVFVTDLYKKYKGKELYKGFYTVRKRIYQDDGEIVTKSIVLDREGLWKS